MSGNSLMASQYRPFLTKLETFLCEQVAKAEDISLSDAARKLVREGWQARTGQPVAFSMPPDVSGGVPAKRAVETWLTQSRADALELLARQEGRTVSSMLNILVRDALNARKLVTNLLEPAE
jgi:hypothetical protein